MKITMLRSLLLIGLLALAHLALAQNIKSDEKPDDRVIIELSAEDWVTTHTANVTVWVEAAVTDSTAATMRADMLNAVQSIVKTDWRLISFNRSQDQTGMEHWSAQFQARVAENQLGGLHETAKKLSRAGMQIYVANIDFTPTLAEFQATKANLRSQILKSINDQLVALNGAMAGRTYRVALVNFTNSDEQAQMVMQKAAMPMMAMASVGSDASSQPMERNEKIVLTAHVVFATNPVNTPVTK